MGIDKVEVFLFTVKRFEL